MYNCDSCSSSCQQRLLLSTTLRFSMPARPHTAVCSTAQQDDRYETSPVAGHNV
jgi:hypothetical protein